MTREQSDELAALKVAFDRVKAFPESDPDGWAKMLDLRQAVERYLARFG